MLQVRHDPEAARNPIQEGTGVVASDSLAAESVREGGGFADNPNSAPSGVPGAKSTLANTDTSAATTLDAAPDANAREAREAWDETAELKGSGAGLKYPEGSGGQPNLQGAMSEQGYVGGPSGTGTGSGSGSGFGSSSSGNPGSGSGSGSGFGSSSGGDAGGSFAAAAGSGAGTSSGGGSGANTGSSTGQSGASSRRDVDAAPTYVQSVVEGGDGKPKGTNLQEGGFEGEAANNDYEIGGEKDPGRAALGKFQAHNEAAVGGTGPVQRELDGKTDYDALNDSEQT